MIWAFFTNILLAAIILSSLNLTFDQRDYQNPIEQQTLGGVTQPDQNFWVINPFVPPDPDPCYWDADDNASISFKGDLKVGEKWFFDQCIILDDTSHALGIQAVSRGNQDRFRVEIKVVSFIKGVFTWQASAVDFPRNGPRKMWAKRCAISPEYDVSEVGSLSAISNDFNDMVGHGDKSRLIWSIENTGDRNIRDISVILNVEPEIELISGC